MLFFVNDYGEGAHPKILENLNKYNFYQQIGYGNDDFSSLAKERIAKKCKVNKDDVYLLIGGTSTNSIVIDSLIKSYEGVVSVSSGHINVHEAGIIEAYGHKVISLNGKEGKLQANVLDKYLKSTFTNPSLEHMVIPGMVYISFPTEYGTLYSKKELEELSTVCHNYNIPLFIDGARLSYALASNKNDVTLDDLKEFADVYYIGGTKIGALCGEAVVFTKNNMPSHFTTWVKRHGGLLAKGRLLGIQFETLFENDLYFNISKNAIKCAEKLNNAMKEKGYRFLIDSPTNQLFPIVSKAKIKELSKNVLFEFWEEYDDEHDVIRFVTSWATKEEDVDKLISLL